MKRYFNGMEFKEKDTIYSTIYFIFVDDDLSIHLMRQSVLGNYGIAEGNENISKYIKEKNLYLSNK